MGTFPGRRVPVEWREPARPTTPVDGSGPLARLRALAVRFFDALLFKPFVDGSPDLLALKYSVSLFHCFEPFCLLIVNVKRVFLSGRQFVSSNI
jgi:hypothetical protein